MAYWIKLLTNPQKIYLKIDLILFKGVGQNRNKINYIQQLLEMSAKVRLSYTETIQVLRNHKSKKKIKAKI